MNLTNELSESQIENFEKLINPESSWPTELRDRFDKRCASSNSYHRDLDKEVVSDYIKEIFS